MFPKKELLFREEIVLKNVNGNLVAEISQERPGVPAGECPKEITNDAGDKIQVAPINLADRI